MERTIGEVVVVTGGSARKGPTAFRWGDRLIEVAEVVAAWQEGGDLASRRKTAIGARQKPMRRYFDIRGRDGASYRLYVDRGSKSHHPQTWVLDRMESKPSKR